eukprot:2883522-Pleurochrysis_carterae.AAC.1
MHNLADSRRVHYFLQKFLSPKPRPTASRFPSLYAFGVLNRSGTQVCSNVAAVGAKVPGTAGAFPMYLRCISGGLSRTGGCVSTHVRHVPSVRTRMLSCPSPVTLVPCLGVCLGQKYTTTSTGQASAVDHALNGADAIPVDINGLAT